MRISAPRLAVVLALLSLPLAACGSGPVVSRTATAPGVIAVQNLDGASSARIHGLGLSGRTLLIATHDGLWAAPPGRAQARPVGRQRQDLMSFSVVRDDTFVASGHPDARHDNVLSSLGLIRSRDRGHSWEFVALAAEADFHVLRASGARIYGFDASLGRFMVSADEGRSWRERGVPDAVTDVAIDPANRDRVIIATGRGLYSSADAGRSWRRIDARRNGLLAWTRPGGLFIVDAQGRVSHSRDGGRRWRTVGSTGGQPSAFVADVSELHVALTDGSVKRSADGAATWTVRLKLQPADAAAPRTGGPPVGTAPRPAAPQTRAAPTRQPSRRLEDRRASPSVNGGPDRPAVAR